MSDLPYAFQHDWNEKKEPGFFERRARFDQFCEKGCGSVIAKGEMYRRTKSTDQVICMACWHHHWPGDST